IITGALLLGSVVLVTAAINRHVKTGIKKAVRAGTLTTHEQPIVYDSVLLKKFIQTVHSLDFNRAECTYAGVVNLTDDNDTSNNVHNLRFLFCRSGKNYYYRIGNTDIIYKDGLNLYVQHDQKKMMLSGQPISIKSPVSNLSTIEKGLGFEHYTLQSSIEGSRQTLSLINERHISCKEISVTRDTVSGKLTRIYARLTDFGSPDDKHKDRIMDVAITGMSNHADMDLYPSWSKYIQKVGGKWRVTDTYQNFELVQF
ncbi:MAG: hypothetical protein ACTHJ8_07840, partial [Mucilaginibacter sp.]